MKHFLKRVLFFFILFAIGVFAFLLLADGYTDSHYLRFTTPKQTSLIIGGSRAAQGIKPEVLNKILGRTDIFNYSFTVAHSRYGPNYFDIIKRKLDTKSKNGVFIVTVDPWSISSLKSELEDTTKFQELTLETAIKFVNVYPNLFYLLNTKFQSRPYINIIRNKNSSTLVHNDGWLEVTVPMDNKSINERLARKIESYKKDNLHNYKYSGIRFSYLVKTINYLKNYGEVYLVRLPIHPLMMEIENQLMPDFDGEIDKIRRGTNTEYYDMTSLNANCVFVDGNHLYKSSANEVSTIIGEWILTQKSKHSQK